VKVATAPNKIAGRSFVGEMDLMVASGVMAKVSGKAVTAERILRRDLLGQLPFD
jgi:hypothetical protein